MKDNSISSLHPMDSLLHAAQTLLSNRLHRLPLIDENPSGETLLYIMTQYNILAFISSHLPDYGSFLDFTPASREIGTWSDIASVKVSTPLIELLSLFITRRISSLPVLDSKGILIIVFIKHRTRRNRRREIRYSKPSERRPEI
jgi:5'-AMP-activated protein kinase regulatory gamma subunit